MLKQDSFDKKISLLNKQKHKEFYNPRHPVILIEGYDGSGKSTISKYVEKYYSNLNPIIYSEPIRENNIRNILVNNEEFNKFFINDENVTGVTDSEIDIIKYYLFMASRSVNLTKICNHISNIEYGGIAIMDRSFPSTMLYQRNLDLEYGFDIIKQNVNLYNSYSEIYRFGTTLDSPDLIIFLDINVQTCINRLKDRHLNDMDPDLENGTKIQADLTYYKRIIDMVDSVTNSKIVTIDANNDIEYVQKSIVKAIDDYIFNYENNDFFFKEESYFEF